MARRGLRKLVDVWGSREAAAPVHDVMQAFLQAHSISYELHHGTDPYRREYWRYLVQGRDLCCAQSVLPAIKDLQSRIAMIEHRDPRELDAAPRLVEGDGDSDGFTPPEAA